MARRRASVLVTTGASEAIGALFCAVSAPGGSIVLPSPVFPAMPVVARAWGLGVKTYRLSRETGFAHIVEQILAAVDQYVRLVVVNSPHNPTGSMMPVEQIERLAHALAERHIPLVVDEVYHPLSFQAPAPSAARLPNTIILGDMSKALSLAGLRTGWVIDRDPVRRKRMLDARSYFTVSGSPILESLAATALAARATILARLQTVTTANLALIDEFMHAHRQTLGWVRPAGGTVTFPWFHDARNTRLFCEALARAGVLLAPGDCFDAPEHFRLGFGAQASGFAEALAMISTNLRSQVVRS